MQSAQKKRLFRFAPTPSGFIHLGNACNFLLTWLYARSNGARILLRIDDLDRDRFRSHYLDDIFRSIDQLGIDYDMGPSGPEDFYQNWSQLKRIELYSENIRILNNNPQSYACSCSRTYLRNGSICSCIAKVDENSAGKVQSRRIKLNRNVTLDFTDIFTGQQVLSNHEIDSTPIYQKSNGFPSYHLTSISDDIYFGVSHIVRGADLLNSSVIQRGLALEIKSEEYLDIGLAHHPLIYGLDGIKLSKSTQKDNLDSAKNTAWKTEDACLAVSRWLKMEGLNNLNELYSAAKSRCEIIPSKNG